MKKPGKTPKDQLKEEKISSLPEKEFRVIIVKRFKISEIECRHESRR